MTGRCNCLLHRHLIYTHTHAQTAQLIISTCSASCQTLTYSWVVCDDLIYTYNIVVPSSAFTVTATQTSNGSICGSQSVSFKLNGLTSGTSYRLYAYAIDSCGGSVASTAAFKAQ